MIAVFIIFVLVFTISAVTAYNVGIDTGKREAYDNTYKYLRCIDSLGTNIQLCKDVYLK